MNRLRRLLRRDRAWLVRVRRKAQHPFGPDVYSEFVPDKARLGAAWDRVVTAIRSGTLELTAPPVAEVVREARSIFVGAGVASGFVGDDVVEGESDVVVKVRSTRTGERIGVRFPSPELPRQGLAYSGVWMRSASDWIHDLRLVLMEELGTGVLFESASVRHGDWTERFISEHGWAQEPDHKVGDWL